MDVYSHWNHSFLNSSKSHSHYDFIRFLFNKHVDIFGKLTKERYKRIMYYITANTYHSHRSSI